MSAISLLSVNSTPEIDYSHLRNSDGFVENSDFEFYKITLPDGSIHIFSDFETFHECFNAVDAYLKIRSEAICKLESLALSPTRLSVAISEILGVSPSPVLFSF